MRPNRKFAIALSFPGEHRAFVLEIAEHLARALGRERIFYDEWHESYLVGPNGDRKLRAVYRSLSEVVVPFFSHAYAKPWCSLEWSAIREVLLTRRDEDCVIPVEIERVEVDGWGANDFPIRVRGRAGREIADLILKAYLQDDGALPSPGPEAGRALTAKSNLSSILALMQSTDVVAAEGAVEALCEHGSSGEDAFLAQANQDLDNSIVLRRCLRYVTLRGDSLAEKLIDGIESDSAATVRRCAKLVAGVRMVSRLRDRVFKVINRHFDGQPGHGFIPRRSCWDAYDAGVLESQLFAYGQLGGSAGWLFDWADISDATWEKLSHFAFKGACTSFARTGEGGEFLQHFLSPERRDGFPRGIEFAMERKRRPIDERNANFEAYLGAFGRWRRRDVLDNVLNNWSLSIDPKVRRMAANIVCSFGSLRTEAAVEGWLGRENDESIALDLSNLAVEMSLKAGSGERYAALLMDAVWTDASKLGSEAVIWFARAGLKLRNGEAMLSDSHWYPRACGCVALAYAGNGAGGAHAREALVEACEPTERLILSIAMALDKREAAGADLHRALVATTAKSEQTILHVELPFLNKAIVAALTDALDRALPASKALWLAETLPFPHQAGA